jgi:3-hydroxyisobutyrate dehydrogenase-like beta-hydroxyacid dehydrogenase
MRIAILGTGLMGSAIGKRLLDTGHQVTVWNRTVDKARPMAERGALVAASADAAISDADAVLLVLHDMHAIQAVLLTELGLEAAAGRTIVQMGTIAPEESVELSARLRAASAAYLEAPVLGSTPQARAGDLLLMIAGDRSVSDRLNPLWSDLGGPRPTWGKSARRPPSSCRSISFSSVWLPRFR